VLRAPDVRGPLQILKPTVPNKKQTLLQLIASLQLFGKVYIEGLLALLKERKDKFNDVPGNYAILNILTLSAIIVFFSFSENVAISVKRAINSLTKYEPVTLSKRMASILAKEEQELSFEEMMKITFSILPSVFGEANYYGTIKNQVLSTFILLRDIRNKAIHPKGITDFLISLKKLEGKDINQPMIVYLESLRNVITMCAKQVEN
jgi:hypothetical protein